MPRFIAVCVYDRCTRRNWSSAYILTSDWLIRLRHVDIECCSFGGQFSCDQKAEVPTSPQGVHFLLHFIFDFKLARLKAFGLATLAQVIAID